LAVTVASYPYKGLFAIQVIGGVPMNGSMQKMLIGVLLILSAYLFSECGTETPPPPTPIPPPIDTPTSIPQKSQLSFGQLRIQTYNNSWLTYEVVAEIKNSGLGLADGFDAACNYDCLPGQTMISSGFSIVQAGFIGPNSSFTYYSPFHYDCLERPPAIDLRCIIQPSDGPMKEFKISGVKLP
jgi:hypothetical protein